MSDPQKGLFSGRWAMLIAMLGMAVGTGNIWRFPRIAATEGGGSFLVAWVVFLLFWSVPLLMVEFAFGKRTRRGPIGAFTTLLGRKWAWLGTWIAFCATAIMFYYAVVMGWTLRFFWAAASGELPEAEPGALWESFAFTPSVLIVHALAMGLGIWVVSRGVRGIEMAAKVLIPSLLFFVVVLAIRAVTLPGAELGLAFLFTPDWSALTQPGIWLAALTQNAWDTGAGWGLVLTYAIYMRAREGTNLNAFVIGFGNNSVSLLAGIMVLCTVFSLLPDAADTIVGAGNEGLTFIWVPALFAEMPGGPVAVRLFMSIFFLALLFAAWSSLIAMIELATRILTDTGITRGRAVLMVGGFGFLLGVPSALSGGIFANQDFVWGVGLMLSGLFFAIGVVKFGADRFRREVLNADAGLVIGRWWNVSIHIVIVLALVLIGWWLWVVREEPLFATFGIGWLALQWALALGLFIGANQWFARRSVRDRQMIPSDP